MKSISSFLIKLLEHHFHSTTYPTSSNSSLSLFPGNGHTKLLSTKLEIPDRKEVSKTIEAFNPLSATQFSIKMGV